MSKTSSSSIATSTASEKTSPEFLAQFFENRGTFSQLTQLDPETLDAIYFIGYKFFLSGKYADAINTFTVLAFFDHTNPKFWRALATSQYKNKNYQDAIQSYDQAYRLDKNNTPLLIKIAECLMSLGQKTEAESTLKSAITLLSANPEWKDHQETAETILGFLTNK